MWNLLVLCLVLSVGCSKDQTDPIEPSDADRDGRGAVVLDLLTNHVTGPFVISKTMDGEPKPNGEGILWGGTASYALSCAENDAIDQAMADLVVRYNGALVRIEPLGEYANGREITWDGAVGFYLGVADSIVRCGRSERWKGPFALHVTYLEEHHGAYHENSSSAAGPGVDSVVNLIAHRLGLRGEVNRDAILAMHSAVAGLVGVTAGFPDKACYRANLAYDTMLTARTLGYEMDQVNRALTCKWSKDFDMPTWDHECGRRHMAKWLEEDYRANEWEFRFQRCGSRETPDGKGLKRPPLDWLLGYRIAHEEV